MPITYTIDQDRQLIRETWTGDVQAADLAAHWKIYLADPAVMAIRRTVVDLRAATIMFSGADLALLVRTVALPILEGRKWISALLVDSPVQHGVSRQYHVFAECYSQDAIFKTMADAEAWLLAQGMPADKA
jgi:hypothetical protein